MFKILSKRYYLLSCIFVLMISAYPLYMGIKVVSDMLRDGAVLKENYPKYIIPYTPVCVAVFAAVALMPLFMRAFKKRSVFAASIFSVGIFFAVEMLFEKNVLVTSASSQATLEDWQMYLCYYNPSLNYDVSVTPTRIETPTQILTGEYSPAFKLHFYLISLVIIIAVLGCIYGFALVKRKEDRLRFRALVYQSVSAALFIGLCILACFTAFWRDGSLEVSALSAVLMTIFFIVLGLTVGIYTGSFLLQKKAAVSVSVPSAVACIATALMYVGEAILLGGKLYRLGDGILFNGIKYILVSPADIMIILMSGALTAVIFGIGHKKGVRQK